MDILGRIFSDISAKILLIVSILISFVISFGTYILMVDSNNRTYDGYLLMLILHVILTICIISYYVGINNTKMILKSGLEWDYLFH